MFGHHKTAWQKIDQQLRQRGLEATELERIEIMELALSWESFWRCLDASVELAIDMVIDRRNAGFRQAG